MISDTEGSHSGDSRTEVIPILKAIPTARTEADLTKQLLGSPEETGRVSLIGLGKRGASRVGLMGR